MRPAAKSRWCSWRAIGLRMVVRKLRRCACVGGVADSSNQGSTAAMNAASHAGGTQLSGLILTESVSILGGSHETVFDAHPDDVRVPSLVVSIADDRCKVAPPSMAQSIAQSIRHAPTTVLTVSGGTQRTQDDWAP
jgi:hypothetical protein